MKKLTRVLLTACAAPLIATTAHATQVVLDTDAAAVAAACGGEVQHDDFVRLPRAKQREIRSCFIRESSKRLNQKLPTRVDYTIILERTTVRGVTTTYLFRADISLKEVEPGAMDAWKPTVRAKICAEPGMRQIVSLGGVYRYVWLDHYGKYIDTLTVKNCPI